ncbi:MAG: hypothetical protein HY901_10220 [Deltaproteobacteria bacterium]|nr:hypothetical protein [Deltaproteobacteria bacterium]
MPKIGSNSNKTNARGQIEQPASQKRDEKVSTPAGQDDKLKRNQDQFESPTPDRSATLLGATDSGPTVLGNPSEPVVMDKDKGLVTYQRQTGQLFVDGPSGDDVLQGSIGDCFLVGTLSAMAYTDPSVIRNAIKDNGNGTYTARFFEWAPGGAHKPVEVTVDSKLPMIADMPAYGASRSPDELWFPMLEKAYAQWKGGYQAIGDGGLAGDVMEAMTGRPATVSFVEQMSSSEAFDTIKAELQAKHAVVAGSSQDDSVRSVNIRPHHLYAVVNVSEEAGQKYITLRNPAGTEEFGNDGKDDGVFKMKMDDFMKHYYRIFTN